MKLFKYQRVSEYSLSSIINGYSWHSLASEFNDPFDTKIIQNELLQQINFAKEYILCLSSINDNLLMWAHYADAHKGFCTEYTEFTEEELDTLKRQGLFPPDAPKHKIGVCAAKPVEYLTTEQINDYIKDIPLDPEEIREVFHSSDEELKSYLQKKIHHSSFIKHVNWEYEQEFRIINTSKHMNLPPGRISAAYFGMNMLPIHKRTVGIALDNATNRNCAFFQMFRPKEKYELSFRRFDPQTDMKNLNLKFGG